MKQANTLKTAVACTVLAAALALPGLAHADEKIDVKLMKAMAERAAAGLGDLRDGYEAHEAPVIVRGVGVTEAVIRTGMAVESADGVVLDRTTTGSIPGVSTMPRTDIRIVYYG